MLQSNLFIALIAERGAEKAAETAAGWTLSLSSFYQRCQGYVAFGEGLGTRFVAGLQPSDFRGSPPRPSA